jgi:hypothetical protein
MAFTESIICRDIRRSLPNAYVCFVGHCKSMRKPIIFYLTLIIALVSLADIITAKFILIGEANPLFVLFGNYWVLAALKIAVVSAIVMMYFKWSNTSDIFQYGYILALVLGILVTGLGVYSNVLGILYPKALAEAGSISSAEKIKEYFKFASFFYYLPIIFSLISFKLYELNKKWN